MNCKSRKILFIFILISGYAKLIELLIRRNILEIGAWILYFLFVAWISGAYWKNKNMPTYSGDFDYKDGKNEFGRSFYMVSVFLCYIWTLFYL